MDILKFMYAQMNVLEIPYEFGEWTSEIQYPYFVGEMTDQEATTEDGMEEYTFVLNGFHRGKILDLEKVKETIKKHFDTIHGVRIANESGAIAAFYSHSAYLPTGEAELKRVQINIKIKRWKGA